MKLFLKCFFCISFAFIISISFFSCRKPDKKDKSKGSEETVFDTDTKDESKKNDDGKKSDKPSIVGVWKYELNGEYRDLITEVIVDTRVYVDYYYEFNADGTGKTYDSTGSSGFDFTYTFENGTITMNADGTSITQKCILTDTTLTVRDEEANEDVIFIRQ